MPGGPAVDDPMLRAIAELRLEFQHLIEEQIVRARGVEPCRPEPILNTAAARRLIALSIAAHAPAPLTEAPGEPNERVEARPLDPRERLNALARHLDHRLRQAGNPGTTET